MDASLETEQDNIAGDHKSEQQGDLEHQIGISEDTDKTARPSLSEFKKSWGFRRTTVAKREFMEEIIDLDPSPVRRGRSRRTRQTRQPAVDPEPPPKPSRSASSVIDNLEWSAPSSPVDTAAAEASTGGALDPSLWQDFGSAFHTAFSLLGGNEDTPMDMADPLPGPDDTCAADFSETLSSAGAELPETGADGSDSVEGAEDPDPPEPALVGVVGDENQEVLLISSQEDDSDNLTLLQLKERLIAKGRTGRGGRGKARGKGRGRGRGRGRGKARGRGRGRAVELESSTADDEDHNLVSQEELSLLHEQQKPEGSPKEVVLDSSNSPSKLIDSDCIILDSDPEHSADGTPVQYDEPEDRRVDEERGYSSISDSEGYDPNALYCLCRQKHNKRFMICCDGCQEWLHGDCVGISEAQGRSMERRREEYNCPTCTNKKQRSVLADIPSEDLSERAVPAGLPNVLASTAAVETGVEVPKQQESKGAAEVTPEQAGPAPDIKTKTDSSFPLCIGPSCPKQALQDSVYCGTDCILKHAAVTMKSLTEPKPRSRPQRKAAARGQRSGGVTPSVAEQLKEHEEEQQGDRGQKEAASPLACHSSLSAVEAAPVEASSVLCMACRYHSLHKHIQLAHDRPSN